MPWLRAETTWPAEVMTCARSASASVSVCQQAVAGTRLPRSPRSSAAEPLLAITMAMPSATATATSATSSSRSMGSGGEELVKSRKAIPATSFTETVLCPKHLTVLGVGGGEIISCLLVFLFIPKNRNKCLLPLNTAYKDC